MLPIESKFWFIYAPGPGLYPAVLPKFWFSLITDELNGTLHYSFLDIVCGFYVPGPSEGFADVDDNFLMVALSLWALLTNAIKNIFF